MVNFAYFRGIAATTRSKGVCFLHYLVGVIGFPGLPTLHSNESCGMGVPAQRTKTRSSDLLVLQGASPATSNRCTQYLQMRQLRSYPTPGPNRVRFTRARAVGPDMEATAGQRVLLPASNAEPYVR
jgi:hypothetical protein